MTLATDFNILNCYIQFNYSNSEINQDPNPNSTMIHCVILSNLISSSFHFLIPQVASGVNRNMGFEVSSTCKL